MFIELIHRHRVMENAVSRVGQFFGNAFRPCSSRLAATTVARFSATARRWHRRDVRLGAGDERWIWPVRFKQGVNMGFCCRFHFVGIVPGICENCSQHALPAAATLYWHPPLCSRVRGRRVGCDMAAGISITSGFAPACVSKPGWARCAPHRLDILEFQENCKWPYGRWLRVRRGSSGLTLPTSVSRWEWTWSRPTICLSGRENVPPAAKWRQGDLADEAFVKSLWSDGPFEYVYHIGAYATQHLSHLQPPQELFSERGRLDAPDQRVDPSRCRMLRVRVDRRRLRAR